MTVIILMKLFKSPVFKMFPEKKAQIFASPCSAFMDPIWNGETRWRQNRTTRILVPRPHSYSRFIE